MIDYDDFFGGLTPEEYEEQTREHFEWLKNNACSNKCIKKQHGYHLYLRCTCGCELNSDIYYWDDFKLCHSCGTEAVEEEE